MTQKKKRVLLIKNDSIGDYIIFRNFLSELRKSDKFQDYELYLLTTNRLAPIAAQMEGPLLKEIIIKPADLDSVPGQLAFYRQLKAYKFEYLLHPTYSPEGSIQGMISHIDAKYKIGFNGDTSNQSEGDKQQYDKQYSQLIEVGDRFSHEFEKNTDFFKAVLKKEPALQKPSIIITPAPAPKKNICICPGAQHKTRIWSLSGFGELITLLSHSFQDYTFTVITGPGENDLFEGIKQKTKVELIHFKIDTLLNMASEISSSSLVICNDSSAAHISVACDVRSVCISNGNHFKRFVPYPGKMKVKQAVVLPPKLLKEMNAGEDVRKYYFGSNLDINEIEVATVLKECELALSKN